MSTGRVVAWLFRKVLRCLKSTLGSSGGSVAISYSASSPIFRDVSKFESDWRSSGGRVAIS